MLGVQPASNGQVCPFHRLADDEQTDALYWIVYTLALDESAGLTF